MFGLTDSSDCDNINRLLQSILEYGFCEEVQSVSNEWFMLMKVVSFSVLTSVDKCMICVYNLKFNSLASCRCICTGTIKKRCRRAGATCTDGH